MKARAIDTLTDVTGAKPADITTANIMASTLSAIVGQGSEDATLSDVGLELTQKATSAFEVRIWGCHTL